MSPLRSYRDPQDPDKIIGIEQPHVDDDFYTRVVRSFPIPTVDVVFTMPGENVLHLARRSVFPAAEPWVIGGRIYFNDDTLEAAMVRTIKRETGIDIDESRLVFVMVAYYSWLRIAQGGAGKNISFTFKLEITPEERDRVVKGLVPSEYDADFGLQSYDRDRLVREKCHPVLLDLYDAIFP